MLETLNGSVNWISGEPAIGLIDEDQDGQDYLGHGGQEDHKQ